MLILKRKKNDSILIGNDIRITVLDCDNGSVSLAINAPKHISILREELTEEEEPQVFDILEKNVFYGMTGKFGPETDEQALGLRSDILKEEERENRMEKRALFYRRLREFFSLVRRQLKELYDILYSR